MAEHGRTGLELERVEGQFTNAATRWGWLKHEEKLTISVEVEVEVEKTDNPSAES